MFKDKFCNILFTFLLFVPLALAGCSDDDRNDEEEKAARKKIHDKTHDYPHDAAHLAVNTALEALNTASFNAEEAEGILKDAIIVRQDADNEVIALEDDLTIAEPSDKPAIQLLLDDAIDAQKMAVSAVTILTAESVRLDKKLVEAEEVYAKALKDLNKAKTKKDD